MGAIEVIRFTKFTICLIILWFSTISGVMRQLFLFFINAIKRSVNLWFLFLFFVECLSRYFWISNETCNLFACLSKAIVIDLFWLVQIIHKVIVNYPKFQAIIKYTAQSRKQFGCMLPLAGIDWLICQLGSIIWQVYLFNNIRLSHWLFINQRHIDVAYLRLSLCINVNECGALFWLGLVGLEIFRTVC